MTEKRARYLTSGFRISIKYHNPICKIEKIEIGDWLDLRCANTVEYMKDSLVEISLGVSMELPEGFEAHIVPRSSTFEKYGLLQVNSIGIIDNSYSGDGDVWIFKGYAVRDGRVAEGDRICQFRIMEKQPWVFFKEVETLGNPDRGGWGKTGIK